MIGRWRASLAEAAGIVVVILGVAIPSASRAETGDETCTGLHVPQAGLRDDNVDSPTILCGGTAVEAAVMSRVLLDTPAFYGSLAGALQLEARWVPSARTLVRLGVRVVDYRFVQNAVIAATEFGVGPIRLGASRVITTEVGGKRLLIAPGIDVSLPFTDTAMDTLALSGFAGVSARWALSARRAVQGRIGAVAWAANNELVGASGRVGANVGALFEQRLGARWMIGGGGEVQMGWFGPGIDHLLVRTGVGLTVGTQSSLGLGIGVRMAGDDRTDAIVSLGFGQGI